MACAESVIQKGFGGRREREAESGGGAAGALALPLVQRQIFNPALCLPGQTQRHGALHKALFFF